MFKIFRLYPIRFSLATLAFIVALAFGQSTQFALWQDDNALIFKLQHLDEQAGVFGPGAFGLGAYRYIAIPYIPIYKIFGMNIPIFYAFAIFFYFLATASIFFLALQLTKNKFLSFFSGAIFAAGFIGSDGILRLFNSIQTSYSVAFVCAFIIFLYRFTQSKKFLDYLLAVAFFFILLETAFIRTQYLIFPTIIFSILFFNWSKFRDRFRNVSLIFPFLLIYYLIFSRSFDPRSIAVKEYIGAILSGKFEHTHSFFGSLGNIILPQPITQFLFKLASYFSLDYTNRLLILELFLLVIAIFLINLVLQKSSKVIRVLFSTLVILWFVFGFVFFQDSEFLLIHSLEYDIPMIFTNFIGGLFLICQGAILITLFKKNVRIGKVLLFSLAWMIFNILAYSTYLPFSPLESINRYLVHSLAAYAILIPTAVYFISKRASISVTVFLVFVNVIFSIDYQNNFRKEKSIPTNKFYAALKQHALEIKKGSVFYFDVADDEKSQQEFRDFFSVGSMPDTTAIAIRYGVDRYDFAMTSNFEQFLSLLKDKPLDFAFSFFYDSGGLKDTADLTRFNLANGDQFNFRQNQELEKPLVTPAVFELRARVLPVISTKQNCVGQLFREERKLLFDYILSRDNFRKEVKVRTSSEERYQTSNFLVDGKADILWRGNRGWWHNNEQEEIIIDLGKAKNVGQLVWVNGYANSTPINYIIEVSVDGKNWYGVKEIVADVKKGNNMVVIDNFPVISVRFVKLVVRETFDNDSPAIGEIEVVEEDFVGIDKNNIKILEKKAFCPANAEDSVNLNEFIRKRGIESNITWVTDKSASNLVGLNLRADNTYHSYKVILPAGGTKVSDLRIESGIIPAEIFVASMRLVYPDRKELIKLFGLQNR